MTNSASSTPQPLKICHANKFLSSEKSDLAYLSQIDEPLVFCTKHQINYCWINHKMKPVFVDSVT